MNANVGSDKIKLLMKDNIKSMDNYSQIYFKDNNNINNKLLSIPLGGIAKYTIKLRIFCPVTQVICCQPL